MTEGTLESRYHGILRRIAHAARAAGRDPSSVKLIAVSKGQDTGSIEALYRLGQRDFGENYAQELLVKAAELSARGCTEIRWHFIGHLQTNKVKALIPVLHAVHTVDSEKLASELAKRWRASGREGKLPVFLEVNVDGEATKSGATVESLPELACKAADHSDSLELRGLMCVPSSEGGLSGRSFRRLRDLELECRPATRGELSMGMTQDFDVAIREGATWVRVGTAIFGPRAA